MPNSEKKNRKKICLISSSGGHFEQLKMLIELNKKYNLVVITEKTAYNKKDKTINYYIPQVNRKEYAVYFKIILISLKSILILLKEKPDVIISTGALATIPLLYFGKKLGIKTIYIESFAKINSPTQTGTFIYRRKLADQFYVQWKQMLKFYPNAIYEGGIY